ncbi:hypothetical protein MNBD_UNCLBAC01-1539 [hydrothermal vent metagenome]|uniref:Uncharacterized protein n=1 Tax=hydrothermal vent metagenome TaxID=652676 RepID=A0A3B1CYA4_9ZZZZ
MMRRNFFTFFLFTVFFIPITLRISCAETISGEIINVNYKYNIAFTDLSSHYLSVGDIVEVRKGRIFVTYLEVSEASGAISKLISVKGSGKYETKVDFKIIKIGNQIVKILSAEEVSNITSPLSLPVEIQTTQQKKNILECPKVAECPSCPVSPKCLDCFPLKEALAEYEDKLKQVSDENILLVNRSAALEKQKIELKSVQEKKLRQLQKEYQRSLNAVREVEIYSSTLEAENKNLKKEFKKVKVDDSKNKIKSLEKKISVLQKKLKYMINFIEGKQNR